MSIAGGLHNALEAGARHRCEAIQIFTKNGSQWAGKALTEEAVEAFRDAADRYRIRRGRLELASHDSYLINLATPDRALLEKSRKAFLDEIRRCDRLGIGRLVFHPGAHVGSGEAAGLKAVARSLDWVFRRSEGSPTRVLLETTAGQGTSLGWRFEHLAEIIERTKEGDRLGVCIDTCHVLAAGYDYRNEEGYQRVFGGFDRLMGAERIEMFHLNDSKKGLDCRVDRHQHIGKGHVGSWAFARILKDPRFRSVPMVLETPKAGDMDRRNLARLRRLGRGRRLPEEPRSASVSPPARR
jgi:deoxyribonuclease-4